jgi:homoserine acetyltransferase
MIATQWALEFPNEVDRLILINSSFSLSPIQQRLKPTNYLGILKCIFSSSAQDIEQFILTTTCNTEKWKPHLSACVQFQKEHRIRLKNFIRQLKMTKHSQFYQKPDCHVIILASSNDRLVSPQCSHTIATQWNVPLHLHPTAGHDLPMDDGTWIIDSIKKG